eukprot:GHVU01031170.1.p1 GENE.GHVU01031170.1~~GHVU01031170.1.p1  ORF type:complete len:169 (+),score=45.83 GHVU01031170.1:60-566(+)
MNKMQKERNDEMEPLMRLLLDKKGIKTKRAKEVGERSVEYFRGKDFEVWVKTNQELIEKAVPSVVAEVGVGAKPLADAMLQRGFIDRAQYMPLEGSSMDSNASGQQQQQQVAKKKKWPSRLTTGPKQTYDSEDFYVIRFEGDQKWRYTLLALLVTGVLLSSRLDYPPG